MRTLTTGNQSSNLRCKACNAHVYTRVRGEAICLDCYGKREDGKARQRAADRAWAEANRAALRKGRYVQLQALWSPDSDQDQGQGV